MRALHLPRDTVFAVNLCSLTPQTEYTSTVFSAAPLCASGSLAVECVSAPTFRCSDWSRNPFVQKLDDQRMGVSSILHDLFTTSFPPGPLLLNEHGHSKVSFQNGKLSPSTTRGLLHFTGFQDHLCRDHTKGRGRRTARYWSTLCRDHGGSSIFPYGAQSYGFGGVEPRMRWFPGNPMEAEREFSNFLDRFNHIATPPPTLYVEEGEEETCF